MSTSPLQLTPVLVEGQIQKIADTAAALVKELPPTFDMKQPTNKKKISKEVEVSECDSTEKTLNRQIDTDYILKGVLSMPNEDPKKMDEVRKFSAIYGRFDCKRKPEKPLTLHEVRTHAFPCETFNNTAFGIAFVSMTFVFFRLKKDDIVW